MSDGWSTFTQLAAVGDVTGDKHPRPRRQDGQRTDDDLPGQRARPASRRRSSRLPRCGPSTRSAPGRWTPSGLPGSAFLSSDGSFVPFVGTTGGSLAGYDWVIGAGDVDGDGVADLIVRDTSGTLWLLPGTSQGYLERRYLAAGFAGYSLGSG